MKKTLIVLGSVILMIFLTSCSIKKDLNTKQNLNQDKNITVTYIIDEICHDVTIINNTNVKMDDVPKISNRKYIGLYLDKEYKSEYCGEVINGDVTLFVKTEKEKLISSEIKNQILQSYLIQFVKPQVPTATIDDVSIVNYYGKYNNAYAVMLNSNHYGYYNWSGAESIADVLIKYYNSNRILVWYEGNFYQLVDAYNNKYLLKDDLLMIADYQKEYYPYS